MGICEHNSNINNTNNYKINMNNKNSDTNNTKNSDINDNNSITNKKNNNNIIINNNNKNDEVFVPNNNINNELCITIEQKEKILKQSKIYICKIHFQHNNEIIYGTGVLCKIPFPDRNYFLPVLITKEHVINKDDALKYKKIKIIFDDKIVKNINFNTERIIFSLKIGDITIIEILPEEDKIFHFYDLEIIEDFNKIINEPIYILQYPEGLKCSFSYGRILQIHDKKYIFYDCSTKSGSSGGPIILLKNYNLIGIHDEGGFNNKINIGSLLNEPLEIFNSENLNKMNKNNYVCCIICDYNVKSNEEFYLLHDYNNQNLDANKELNILYIEGKKKKKLLEENISIYIDDQLIKFNFKYKTNKAKINVKFIFHKIITDLSFLFYKCAFLETVDLSPFNGINIDNTSYMFGGCESLKSIEFFSFNTSSVTNMSGMFSECKSLETIDLSSFDTKNVLNMSEMFFYCSSIKRFDLTKFNTMNVANMSKMFANCDSLKFLYFNSFKTNNVTNMAQMFSGCSTIKSLDLSHFNTSKVVYMDGMFEYCAKLEYLNITSFNTFNVISMKFMFCNCSYLKSLDLSSFNTMNVENMILMFAGCIFLESLDISSFNIINVKEIGNPFNGCSSLKNVKCNDEKLLKLVESRLYLNN